MIVPVCHLFTFLMRLSTQIHLFSSVFFCWNSHLMRWWPRSMYSDNWRMWKRVVGLTAVLETFSHNLQYITDPRNTTDLTAIKLISYFLGFVITRNKLYNKSSGLGWYVLLSYFFRGKHSRGPWSRDCRKNLCTYGVDCGAKAKASSECLVPKQDPLCVFPCAPPLSYFVLLGIISRLLHI